MQSWPEDLFEFAWFPNRDDQLRELADQAEEEDWQYQYTPKEYAVPILFNYIRYTYRRLAEERKINLSANGDFACFNTGLVTPNQESLFASFEANRREDAPHQWYFKGWYRRGQRRTQYFSQVARHSKLFF